MGLFGVFKKKPVQKQSIYREDLDHLNKDGELPFGWVTVYKDFVDSAQAEVMYFYQNYGKNQYGDPKKKYAALKSLLLYIEDAKKLYAQKGECFLFWFENWWAKPDEVQRLTDDLRYMEEHFDELEAEYKEKLRIEKRAKEMRKEIPSILKGNPGILQTEVYKHFPLSEKSIVSDVLYHMAGEGIIEREKSGRTYSIRIK